MADPKQQKMFDMVMANVRGMIFNDAGIKGVLDKIQSAEKGPVQGVAHTAAMLVKSVDGGIKQQGKMVPQPVLFGALRGAVGDLTEVAAAANIIPEEEKPKVAQAALPEAAQYLKQPQPAQGQQPPGAAPGMQPAPAQPSPQVDGIVNSAMGAV